MPLISSKVPKNLNLIQDRSFLITLYTKGAFPNDFTKFTNYLYVFSPVISPQQFTNNVHDPFFNIPNPNHCQPVTLTIELI